MNKRNMLCYVMLGLSSGGTAAAVPPDFGLDRFNGLRLTD